MGFISDIHNSALKILNDLIGWEDVYINLKTSSGNPMDGSFVESLKQFQVRALISKNESAYKRADNTDKRDFMLCKISVDDIVEINTAQGVNIPVPPNGSLKSKNVSISIAGGNSYQISVEGTGSFDGRN